MNDKGGGPRPPRRTQADRSAATRAALVDAARPLFAARGFAAVGSEELVRAAGVTRGALYHHFGGKERLFEAVFEAVEHDLAERLAAVVAAGPAARGGDPVAALAEAAEAWLDACREPEVQRIGLLDAPVVLGWERWREIGWRYGMGLVEAGVQAAMDAGRLRPAAVRPLSHLLLGALEEAGLLVGRAEDQEAARDEMAEAVRVLLGGLAA